MVSTEKMDSLYDAAVEKANVAAQAMNEGKPLKDIKELKKLATNAMAEYNNEAAHVVYRRWAEEGDAVKTAIRIRYIPGFKRLSFKETKSGTTYAKIDDGKSKIDFIDLAETIGYEKFSNENWIDACQKLAYILAGFKNDSLNADSAFKYIIKESAEMFKFPVDINPTTKEGVMIALQQVYDYICFIDDGNGRNRISVRTNRLGECVSWNYISECMTRQGNEVGAVLLSGAAKIVELVADCMNLDLTCGDYKLLCDD